MTVDDTEFYRARTVMITGGLEFVGSSLTRRLVELGVAGPRSSRELTGRP